MLFSEASALNGTIRRHVDDHFFADLDRLYVTGLGTKADMVGAALE
jgi:hypothetical protein